jgi:hypothetical protein
MIRLPFGSTSFHSFGHAFSNAAPSIGKPVFGSCEERTRESVWDRSADHIRASGQTAALKGRIHDRTRPLR